MIYALSFKEPFWGFKVLLLWQLTLTHTHTTKAEIKKLYFSSRITQKKIMLI